MCLCVMLIEGAKVCFLMHIKFKCEVFVLFVRIFILLLSCFLNVLMVSFGMVFGVVLFCFRLLLARDVS